MNPFHTFVSALLQSFTEHVSSLAQESSHGVAKSLRAVDIADNSTYDCMHLSDLCVQLLTGRLKEMTIEFNEEKARAHLHPTRIYAGLPIVCIESAMRKYMIKHDGFVNVQQRLFWQNETMQPMRLCSELCSSHASACRQHAHLSSMVVCDSTELRTLLNLFMHAELKGACCLHLNVQAILDALDLAASGEDVDARLFVTCNNSIFFAFASFENKTNSVIVPLGSCI